ncbi:MAG: hypothetical protein OXN89_20340 [Bryobacterales bacterium]|nr:hypothetical protein [Bryobacterales bacterium]
MAQPQTLFASDGAEPPTTGLLVTNHLNLLYMLSAGLILPPEGFGEKYYRDTVRYCPGWIPLFVGKPAAAALEESVAEVGHLKPCIAEIDLEGISGSAFALRHDRFEAVDFPSQADKATDRAILLPAPLPTSRIKRLIYRSVAEKKQVNDDALDFANVTLKGLAQHTVKAKFNGYGGGALPQDSAPSPRSAPLQVPLAVGGVVAMLLWLGNRGALSAEACVAAFDPEETSGHEPKDPILAGLRPWLQSGQCDLRPKGPTDPVQRADLPRWLFWGVVDRIVVQRSVERRPDARASILDYLKETASALDERLRKSLQQLAHDLESLSGFGDLSESELFQRHPKPFSRALGLFFLCDECDALFDSDRPMLNEVDFLAAAILLGASSGWEGLPNSLRDFPGLADAVSDRMAAMSHHLAGSALDLGAPAARCQPLREAFGATRVWDARRTKAAVALAERNGWNCVKTTIRLGKGDYELRVKPSGLEIVFGKEPEFNTSVNRATFFDLLARERISTQDEEAARKALGLWPKRGGRRK